MRINWNTFVNKALFWWMFLLPWQTVFLFNSYLIKGTTNVYGQIVIPVTGVLLICIGIIHTWKNGWNIPIERKSVLKIGGVFLLFLLVTLFFSEWPMLGVETLIHVSALSFLLVFLLDKNIQIHLLLKGFIYGLCLPVLMGIMQFLTGHSPASTWLGLSAHEAAVAGDSIIKLKGVRMLRAYGSFPHPNVFGGYLAVSIIACGYLYTQCKSKLWMALAVFFSLGLFLTFSQSAWIAVVMSFVIGAYLYKRIHKKGAVNIWAFHIATAIMFVIAFAGTLSLPYIQIGIEHDSVLERIEYIDIWYPLMSGDWLIGSGAGSYIFSWESMDPLRNWWEYQPVHNVPLLLIKEIGLIGVLLLGYLLYRIDTINYRALPRHFAFFSLLCGSVLFIIMFFDHYLWSFWPGLALSFLVLGLTARGTIE